MEDDRYNKRGLPLGKADLRQPTTRTAYHKAPGSKQTVAQEELQAVLAPKKASKPTRSQLAVGLWKPPGRKSEVATR